MSKLERKSFNFGLYISCCVQKVYKMEIKLFKEKSNALCFPAGTHCAHKPISMLSLDWISNEKGEDINSFCNNIYLKHNLFKRILKYWKQDGKIVKRKKKDFQQNASNFFECLCLNFILIFPVCMVFFYILFHRLLYLRIVVDFAHMLVCIFLFSFFCCLISHGCCGGQYFYSIWSLLKVDKISKPNVGCFCIVWCNCTQGSSNFYLRWEWLWRTAHQIFILITNWLLDILWNESNESKSLSQICFRMNAEIDQFV